MGKTSLLVQFDQGKFQTGSFAATVGIGFTVSTLCVARTFPFILFTQQPTYNPGMDDLYKMVLISILVLVLHSAQFA